MDSHHPRVLPGIFLSYNTYLLTVSHLSHYVFARTPTIKLHLIQLP
nr:MAG TPA: hypothetical protein [Caudoviricetes sp.]